MITGLYFLAAIHEYFGDEVVTNLVDHNSQYCLVCNANMSEANSNESSPAKMRNNNSDLFGKIGMAMRLKSQEVKGKLFDYIVNPSASANGNGDSHNSRDADNTRRQRNTAPVFSIDDDHDPGMYSEILLSPFIFIFINDRKFYSRYDNDQPRERRAC